MVHSDANHDDEETKQTKEDQAKMELDFLKNLPRKTKSHLIKRLKHLQLQGALKV